MIMYAIVSLVATDSVKRLVFILFAFAILLFKYNCRFFCVKAWVIKFFSFLRMQNKKGSALRPTLFLVLIYLFYHNHLFRRGVVIGRHAAEIDTSTQIAI